jgi:hypothetical protein
MVAKLEENTRISKAKTLDSQRFFALVPAGNPVLAKFFL